MSQELSKDLEQFEESYQIFKKHREANDKIVGFCVWRCQVAGFLLEAWNHTEKGVVIFGIFSGGNGYHGYSYDKEI